MNRRIITIIISVLLLCMGLAGTTLAHANLDRSEPAANARLTEAPNEVRLFFTQSLKAGTTASVLDASGKQVDNKDGKIDLNDLDRKTYVLTVPVLVPGTYTVRWTSVSEEDGDSTSDSFSFTIQGAAQVQPTAAATQPTTAATQPTAAATTQPTTAATTQPTAAPAGGSSPTNLPATSEGAPNLAGYALIGALTLLAGGLALRRSKHGA